MRVLLLCSVLAVCVTALRTDSALLRLKDVPAAEAFIDSVEVAVIGFFQSESARGYTEFLEAVKQTESLPVALCAEPDVWAKYGVSSDTVSIFRKADLHQEHLKISEAKNIVSEGLVRFMLTNNIGYVTEYSQVSAVGLFQSPVRTHLLLLSPRGRSHSDPLHKLFRDLAVTYAGKMLFVLVNGSEVSNARVLQYFGVKSGDLPRIGLYDVTRDQRRLMEGEISTERVHAFCHAHLHTTLEEAETPEDKTEL